MRGSLPSLYKLKPKDHHHLTNLGRDSRLVQRIARRVQVLLALDRGDRIVDILRWTGLTRMAVWYLWQRYQARGVEAVFDVERSGRPPLFSPSPKS